MTDAKERIRRLELATSRRRGPACAVNVAALQTLAADPATWARFAALSDRLGKGERVRDQEWRELAELAERKADR
ncbi:MAG: hypothetical protein KF699_12090 [Phycisphaeraceae bacterium]|nr:hypothetical protein [Phycisphaeraceae bacterium]